MQKRTKKTTVLLTSTWVLTILYGEMISFWVPYYTCSWPQLPSSEMINDTSYIDGPVRVAVLADPQFEDRTSHGLTPNSLALETLQFYTDLYMRRSFLQSVLPFKPDMILFLGDYFDGGPLLSDEEWKDSVDRFKHIFNIDHNGRSSNIPVYYIPGNHDIGYGSVFSRNPEVISRYENEFGPRNHQFSVGKVEFVAVDSQTLDGPKDGVWTSKSWNFVKNLSTAGTPSVLLTHIPLYRPDWTSCGVHRSSPIINQRLRRAADQEVLYQNYLSEETSGILLDMIKPVLVLSGHDHDQCTVTHPTRHGFVKEHTLGTLSWQQGNLFPSFILLSATNRAFSNITSPEDAVATQLCFLPWQTHIYIWYLFLLVCTVLVLLFCPRAGDLVSELMGSIVRAVSSITSKDGSKVKDNDDEICEYEEIWDAEGSMHLIKKTIKRAEIKHSNDSGLVGRGNVIVRPTAKKNALQDLESSSALKIDVDDGGKILQRSDQVKRKSRIVQILRTLRALVIIAAVNIPLYMMLLFKDWAEQ